MSSCGSTLNYNMVYTCYTIIKNYKKETKKKEYKLKENF